MDRKPQFLKLSKKSLQLIKKLGNPFTYTVSTDLFYENQTPIVAYILLEGELILTKNRREISSIPPCSALGLVELIGNKTCQYAAKVKKDTTLYFLDKSSIFELLTFKDKLDQDFAQLITQLEPPLCITCQ